MRKVPPHAILALISTWRPWNLKGEEMRKEVKMLVGMDRLRREKGIWRISEIWLKCRMRRLIITSKIRRN